MRADLRRYEIPIDASVGDSSILVFTRDGKMVAEVQFVLRHSQIDMTVEAQEMLIEHDDTRDRCITGKKIELGMWGTITGKRLRL